MKTTREEAREENQENIVDNLQGLLEKNYDAEKGYRKAMEDVKTTRLKGFLKQQAATRNRFATELDQQIRSLNATPKESGSVTGTLHRAWMDVKTAVSSNNDEAVLEECIRGDKASLEEYEDTLNNNQFPPQISSVLNKQASDIRTTLSSVKNLEDLAEDLN